MSNKIYDILKWIALIALPASATLVEVVCGIWKLPYGAQISTTITAIGTFLGTLLMISSSNYNKKLENK